ncbi:hypothetical protein V6N13_016870 [Hibiscus sabdariffa]
MDREGDLIVAFIPNRLSSRANGNHVLSIEAHGTGDLQQKSQESVAPTVANASIVVPSTFANIEEATSLAMSYDSTGAQHACDTRT